MSSMGKAKVAKVVMSKAGLTAQFPIALFLNTTLATAMGCL